MPDQLGAEKVYMLQLLSPGKAIASVLTPLELKTSLPIRCHTERSEQVAHTVSPDWRLGLQMIHSFSPSVDLAQGTSNRGARYGPWQT